MSNKRPMIVIDGVAYRSWKSFEMITDIYRRPSFTLPGLVDYVSTGRFTVILQYGFRKLTAFVENRQMLKRRSGRQMITFSMVPGDEVIEEDVSEWSYCQSWKLPV